MLLDRLQLLLLLHRCLRDQQVPKGCPVVIILLSHIWVLLRVDDVDKLLFDVFAFDYSYAFVGCFLLEVVIYGVKH